MKNRIEIASPAKINLFLELHGRRPDGFHEIDTVMSAVSIFDRLSFTKRSDSSIQLKIQYPARGRQTAETDPIPTDDRNLIVKAVNLVRENSPNSPCTPGMDIVLSKQIPSAAGLGGASSNAAAALIAANELWDLNLPKTHLEQLAAQLGSDIGFFLTGGTAVCRGRGEQVQPIECPAGHFILVAKPTAALSTADVFKQVSASDDIRSSVPFIESVRLGQCNLIGKKMFNRLEQFASGLASEIDELRKAFSNLNCLGHQMSGSGSSYFGLFPNAQSTRQAFRRLSSRLPALRIFCTQTISPFRL
ncbi:MAG: 4-(cytidine 5'-diphospho)-2-C-methyl-D-erythritol kinase [Mariniblastus sp.]